MNGRSLGRRDLENIKKLEQLRNQLLPDSLKSKYGIPLDKKVTRADWGEHEYRQKEWIASFEKAGFDVYLFRRVPYKIRGFSRLLLISPFFDPAFLISVMRAKAGAKMLNGFSFTYNRVAFFCIKK